MKITVCGSLAFIEDMKQARTTLEAHGHEVLLPESADLNQDKAYWSRLKQSDERAYRALKGERMRGHFDKIKAADAILVLNHDKNGIKGYIGANTLIEMAIAFEHGKKIFTLNELPQGAHEEELAALAPECLGGELGRLC